MTAEEVLHRLNQLVLRALDTAENNVTDADNAIVLARQMLGKHSLHSNDFKLTLAHERSAKELINDLREANTPPDAKAMAEQIVQLTAELEQLRSQNADKDSEIAGFKQQLAQRERRVHRLRRTEPNGVTLEADINRAWGVLSNPQLYQIACKLHIDEQKSAAEAAAYMGLVHKEGKNAGQPRTGVFDGAFNNKPPNESLLGRTIEILDEGEPMDFYELWKIGFALHGDRWRKTVSQQFGTKAVSRNAPGKVLSQVQMDQLRREYRTIMRMRHRS